MPKKNSAKAMQPLSKVKQEEQMLNKTEVASKLVEGNSNGDSMDKDLGTCARKLKSLFIEKKKSQQELIDYIKSKDGREFKRQTVSMWLHGNSPDLKTLPLIAEFFGVTTDYLLTETKEKTNIDINSVCQFTGLSEQTIEKILYYNEYTDESSEGIVALRDFVDIFFGDFWVENNTSKKKKVVDDSVFHTLVELLHNYVVAAYQEEVEGYYNPMYGSEYSKWLVIKCFEERLERFIKETIKNLRKKM